MTFEIQVLAWDRHAQNVAGLNRLMVSPSYRIEITGENYLESK